MNSLSWNELWDKNIKPWHSESRNKILEEYADSLVGQRTKVRIFFPLCGKAVDMKWFYDKGHEVVGVELCEKPVLEFFEEQGLAYNVNYEGDLKSFTTHDKRLTIYLSDIYKLNIDLLDPMDIVFDRGAMTAIDKEDRIRYAAFMKSLLTPEFQYLLVVPTYDDWYYSGAPHNVPDGCVLALFAADVNVQLLRSTKKILPEQLAELVKVEEIYEKIWLLTPKDKE